MSKARQVITDLCQAQVHSYYPKIDIEEAFEKESIGREKWVLDEPEEGREEIYPLGEQELP